MTQASHTLLSQVLDCEQLTWMTIPIRAFGQSLWAWHRLNNESFNHVKPTCMKMERNENTWKQLVVPLQMEHHCRETVDDMKIIKEAPRTVPSPQAFHVTILMDACGWQWWYKLCADCWRHEWRIWICEVCSLQSFREAEAGFSNGDKASQPVSHRCFLGTFEVHCWSSFCRFKSLDPVWHEAQELRPAYCLYSSLVGPFRISVSGHEAPGSWRLRTRHRVRSCEGVEENRYSAYVFYWRWLQNDFMRTVKPMTWWPRPRLFGYWYLLYCILWCSNMKL